MRRSGLASKYCLTHLQKFWISKVKLFSRLDFLTVTLNYKIKNIEVDSDVPEVTPKLEQPDLKIEIENDISIGVKEDHSG